MISNGKLLKTILIWEITEKVVNIVKGFLVDAVFYVIKTGCQWRFLPKEYPSWKTVYSFYKRAKDKGLWEKIMKDLVEKSRLKMGLKPCPAYSLIDSQSIKTTDKAEERGIDGGKKNKRT